MTIEQVDESWVGGGSEVGAWRPGEDLELLVPVHTPYYCFVCWPTLLSISISLCLFLSHTLSPSLLLLFLYYLLLLLSLSLTHTETGSGVQQDANSDHTERGQQAPVQMGFYFVA